MNTEEDDEFKRIEMESGWRKRQIEQSELCSNYGGFCKKEWVGLTNEDEMILVEEARKVPTKIPCPDYNERLIRLTESKLKERNT